jgi:hypothetical protein
MRERQLALLQLQLLLQLLLQLQPQPQPQLRFLGLLLFFLPGRPSPHLLCLIPMTPRLGRLRLYHR